MQPLGWAPRGMLFAGSILFSLFLLANLAFGQDFYRLPASVNAYGQSQVAPVISADGKTLYFARARLSVDSDVITDIWKSDISSGTYALAEYVGGRLASRHGVAVTSVAPDNNTLYLMGMMSDDAALEERIYETHRTKDGWSMPESIRIHNLNLHQGIFDFNFGADQKTLLMAVNRDSTMGDRDLYVSFLDEQHRQWTTPRWLGSDVNSQYTEMTPFLGHDGKTLYFSSNRPGGMGSVDVYRTTRLDDSWQHWSKPENMGAQVNREGRNSYYTEDAQGKYAYLCWRGTEQDVAAIYKILVPHAEAAVALIRGKVHDEDGKPLLASIRYARLSDGKEMGMARSNPETGEYQLSLPGGEQYSARAEKDGYLPTSETFDLRALKQYQDITRDLTLNKIKTGARIELKSVFFETDKWDLLPSSIPELERLRGVLAERPKLRISIEGHTDSSGSAEHNRLLSLNRANSVRAWLTNAGIDASRIETIGHGPSKPIATNNTEEGRALNRRVEFVVLGDEK